MSVILKFRHPENRSRKAHRSDNGDGQVMGEVVIFPGIRVDYGPVEAALAGPQATSRSGKGNGKRRKA
jgi:hypothetical protein